MIDVTFQHWSYVFSGEELSRYGSRYFSQKTAGQVLLKAMREKATRKSSHQAAFDPKQILCANEAFPEAAIADPLADLEVWDDWRSGSRAFPYPGRYSRLQHISVQCDLVATMTKPASKVLSVKGS